METQYTLASVLFVLEPGKDILTLGRSPELPSPALGPYTEAICWRKETADTPKKSSAPPPALLP